MCGEELKVKGGERRAGCEQGGDIDEDGRED